MKDQIYLAGTKYTEEPAASWKIRFESSFGLAGGSYTFYDPMKIEGTALTVVARDKFEIRKSKFFVAYIERFSIGTTMEIFFANSLGYLPVIIVDPGGIVFNNIWIEKHSDLVVADVRDAAQHIFEINL